MPPLVDYRLPLDEMVFGAVNGLHTPLLSALWMALSSRLFLLPVTLLLAVTCIARLGVKQWRRLLSFGLAFAFVDGIGSQVLKPLFHRLRPNAVLTPGTFFQLDSASSGSLPSLHAANAMLVALLASTVFPRLRALFFVLAALVSLSRLGVGVHWPSDILVGALWGGGVGWLVLRLTPQVESKAEPSAPQ
jgi:undecaprenyl-diphosphatase